MAAVSKQEYLKRYLSNNDDEKKKKRKTKPKVGAKFAKSTIVDDDVALSDIKLDTGAGVQVLNVDEAPVIYDEDGVTAISTEHFQKREEDMKRRWVPVRADDGENEEGQTGRHDSDSDVSPPRSRRRHDSSDDSPPRKKRSGSPDISPRRRNSRDNSPHGKTRNDSPDISPPRRSKNKESSPDLSPSRPDRRRGHSNRDVHSSRKDTHLSESRLSRRRKDSDSDIAQRHHRSPPQRRTRHDSDLSPPRRGGNSNSDQSPLRRRTRHDSDLSPPHRGGNIDSDQSPPRKSVASPERREKTKSKEEETVKKGGLLSARDLREDNELKKKRDRELLDNMDPTLSGRDAKTVHRNKEGKIRNLKVERLARREEEKKKEAEDEKFMQWGKGLVQTQSKEQRIKDDIHEMAKPLARYRNDADLDEMQRERERTDDPMLKFMTKKRLNDEKSGKKAKPVYKGPAPPPNRFGIRPGYRWDGVDRSNGFEKKRFQMLSNKKSTQLQAYKWSTEDM